MTRTDRQLATATVGVLGLVAVLWYLHNVSAAGLLAGFAYAGGLALLLGRAARRAGATTLGPAGAVTLLRAVLVGGVTVLVADGLWTGARWGSPLVELAAVALALDAVDGRVARRTRTITPLGARFDMELDAFLLLVLSAHVAVDLGEWVLAIGLMRYAWVVATWVLPRLREPLPPRYSAKVVAAIQGIALVVASSGLVAPEVSVVLVATALTLLIWSFGHDLRLLWRGDAPGRRVLGRAVTVLAGVLVLVALIAPAVQPGRITPGAFARIPLEALVGVVALVVLPARWRRPAAATAGLVLGLIAVLTLLDLGFDAALARRFDPVLDWETLGFAVGLIGASVGRTEALAVLAVVTVFAVALVVLLTLAVRRLSAAAARHRAATLRGASALGCVWLVCALFGAQLVPGVPAASAAAAGTIGARTAQVAAGLRDPEVFAAEIAADRFRDVPADQLLDGLRGKDVALVFVESYGRAAVADPELAPDVGAVLEDGTRRLAAAGFGARSGYLTSPTTGGQSWLAHSTLTAGVRIGDQRRYRILPTTDRLTLGAAFQRAGWRTVGVMPGVTSGFPEAGFYGYGQILDAPHLDYHGPSFSWATMPDQYTLSAFQRLERAVPGRGPVMAEIPLVSSHTPWDPLPHLIGWDQVGDGSVFASMAGQAQRPDVILTRDPHQVRAAYRQSIQYSLATLVSYVETYGDDNLVLVFLGDHQPARVVTGRDAGTDVPITIVARDRAVLDRISDWGWTDGLRPAADAPVWQMDEFRDRFLTAFTYGQARTPGS